jgi:hypothetical protein
MRIAIFGTHCCGKSTLIDEFLHAHLELTASTISGLTGRARRDFRYRPISPAAGRYMQIWKFEERLISRFPTTNH